MKRENNILNKYVLSTYITNQGLSMAVKQDIQALDIVNIAFAYIKDNIITLDYLENIEYIKQFKKWNPALKMYLSVASGVTCSFGESVSTIEKREKLIKSMMDIVEEWEFDGLDIDWEYPVGEEERRSHTILLKRLREELDILEGKGKKGLSIAAGSKTWYFEITELEKSIKYLDYVNLMTYDMNANCLSAIHHTCPAKMGTELEKEGSTEENIELFLKKGVPREKLIIGAAFYSRQWRHVENKNHGLYSYSGEKSDYGPSYTQLMEEYIDKNGYTRYWDSQANAPYLFNGDNFITYEDKESLKCKCALVRKWDIAGIMSWEYSYDKNHELIPFMRTALENKE